MRSSNCWDNALVERLANMLFVVSLDCRSLSVDQLHADNLEATSFNSGYNLPGRGHGQLRPA